MATKSQAAQEKEWRAQDDAHMLAAAQEIKNDPTRLKNAQAAAGKMASEQEKRTKALKTVAGRQTTVKTGRTNSKTQNKSNTPKTQSNTKIPGKKK